MKQSTKIMLIIAGILAGFGLCLCIVSACLGMTFATMRQMISDGELSIPFSFGSWHRTYTVTKEYASIEDMTTVAKSQVHSLYIEVDNVEFKIEKSSDSSNISLEMNDEAKKHMEWGLDGDTLHIYDNDGSWDWNSKKSTATLYVPENMEFREMTVDVNAGSFTSNIKMSCEYLALDVDAGKIDAADIRAMSAELNCDAGELKFKGSIEDTGFADVDAGSIVIQMPEDTEKNFNYEISADAGKITVGGQKFNGISVEQYIDNMAGKSWNLSCDAGSIELSFK